MSTIPRYIDSDDSLSVGQVGFLIEVCPEQRADTWQIRDIPLHTNQSHEPRLSGWCGTTDNVARFARGMARVVAIAKNGRVRIVALTAAEMPAALELLGYPELAELRVAS